MLRLDVARMSPKTGLRPWFIVRYRVAVMLTKLALIIFPVRIDG